MCQSPQSLISAPVPFISLRALSTGRDRFNLKYNPCGDSLLRTIFLKTDNYLGGRYLAELTKELFADLEETKYQLSEYRLSIYGRKSTEWRKLAQWVMSHGLVLPYNKWQVIQHLMHFSRLKFSIG